MTTKENLKAPLEYFINLYETTLKHPETYPVIPIEVIKRAVSGMVKIFNVFSYKQVEYEGYKKDGTRDAPHYSLVKDYCTRDFWILFKEVFKPTKQQHSFTEKISWISIYSESNSIIAGNVDLFNSVFEKRFMRTIEAIQYKLYKKDIIDTNKFRFFYKEI